MQALEQRTVQKKASIYAPFKFSVARQGIYAAHDYAERLYSECLTRIVSSNDSTGSPVLFLDHLRSVGQYYKHDLRMLEVICETLRAEPGVVLACNVSPSTIVTARRQLIAIIGTYFDVVDRLVLEIVEDSPDIGSREFVNFLALARAHGIRVALDDFGTGFAVPLVLEIARFDMIKIDKSFFSACPDKRREGEQLTRLARINADVVIAEGIETLEQADMARAWGATHLQGYLLGRPS